MIQSNSKLRARVCKALLDLVNHGHLWNNDGPTKDAHGLLLQYGGPMSNEEWLMLQLAWHVWGRPTEIKVEELMRLGEPRRELTTSLLHAIATSDSAVEEWLSRVEGKQGVAKGS